MPQPVIHFEIHGKDGRKSQEFYSKLFGWNVDANNPMGYGMVPAAERGIGGGITQSDEAPMVMVYIEVDDLTAALKKAESLGARTIMAPQDVPDGPAIAQFEDPDGNRIGLVKGM